MRLFNIYIVIDSVVARRINMPAAYNAFLLSVLASATQRDLSAVFMREVQTFNRVVIGSVSTRNSFVTNNFRSITM